MRRDLPTAIRGPDGPTGLLLALVLSKLGVVVRIVDKEAEPRTTSRALAVQARTRGYASSVASRSMRSTLPPIAASSVAIGRTVLRSPIRRSSLPGATERGPRCAGRSARASPAVRTSTCSTSPISKRDWQAHVYGTPPDGVAAACAARAVPLERFAFDAGTEAASLARDAVYLVRPDGYVGGAFLGASSAAAVARYLEEHGIKNA